MSFPTTELGNLVRIRTGKIDANRSFSEGLYPFFTCAAQPLRIAEHSFDCECVLVAGNGAFNVRYYDGKFDASQRTYIIESQNKDILDVRYLFHFMAGYVRTLRHLSLGAGVKYIKRSNLADAKIPLPSVREQRHIVGILDKMEFISGRRQQGFVALDRLAQTTFLEMFGCPAGNPKGWEKRRLAELVSRDDVINYGVVRPGESVDDGVPLVRAADLVEGRVDHQHLRRISPAIDSAHARSRLNGDELLVGCVGAVGVIALASPREKGFNIARAVARFRVDECVDRVFLAGQLRTAAVQAYFRKEVRTGGPPTLNIQKIAGTPVIFPPLALQRAFASRLTAIEAMRARFTASAQLSASMASALRIRMFRGAL